MARTPRERPEPLNFGAGPGMANPAAAGSSLSGAAVHAAGQPFAVFPAPRHDPLVMEIAWRSRAIMSPGDDPEWAAPTGEPLVPGDGAGSDDGPLKRAAVLMVLGADAAGELSVVMIKRAEHLARHAGQVALPGGKMEEGETPTGAALREACEEVALPSSAVDILGTTTPYLTRTGFCVVPVLGLLRNEAVLRPDPGEVAAVFSVPFRALMALDRHRTVHVEHKGIRRTTYEVMIDGTRVWGVTAGIVRLVHQKLFGP
ncbi:MAG: CoA pyrophosphatase [Pseudomonadota bacterium]